MTTASTTHPSWCKVPLSEHAEEADGWDGGAIYAAEARVADSDLVIDYSEAVDAEGVMCEPADDHREARSWETRSACR